MRFQFANTEIEPRKMSEHGGLRIIEKLVIQQPDRPQPRPTGTLSHLTMLR